MRNTEYKKDFDKNADLPDPRDLQTRFSQLEKRLSKFRNENSSSSWIKNLVSDHKKYSFA